MYIMLNVINFILKSIRFTFQNWFCQISGNQYKNIYNFCTIRSDFSYYQSYKFTVRKKKNEIQLGVSEAMTCSGQIVDT